MTIFLQVLGAIFLTLVLLVVGAFFYIRGRIRRGLKEFAEGLEELAEIGDAETPVRIHLRRRELLEWNDAATVEEQAAALRGLGFQDAGRYEVPEIAALRLEALTQPETSVYGVVYEHDRAGIWIDLVSRYEDGTSVTYASTGQGGGLDQRPGHSVTRHDGMPAAELYRRLLAERPGRPLSAVSEAAFPRAFEQAYADSIDWRNSRGGPTDEELRAVAAASGRPLSEETLELLREQMRAKALAGLEASLRERFLEETAMPAAEWEEIRERVVFIHDRMTREGVAETFTTWTAEECGEEEEDEEDEEDEREFEVPEGTPRQAFAALNAGLPEERRFRKIGEVSRPVEADVYCAAGE